MIEAPTRYEALLAAVNRAGSQSQFARDTGASQPTVWRWINQSKQLPAEYVLTVEKLYDVSRHHLRPDIYPIEPLLSPDRVSAADQRAGARFVGADHRARHGKKRVVLCRAGAGQ